MLYEEAKWVGNMISKYFHSEECILNLGSSTKELRELRQPHMHEFIFEPAKLNNLHILHVDISVGEGIDIVGDLTDPLFIQLLKHKKPKGILCCNLLEHLEDRRPFFNSFHELLEQGAYAIITVPYLYPYHLDPIDTLYRPSAQNLTNDLMGFKLIEAIQLKAKRKIYSNGKIYYQKNYFEQLKNDRKLFVKLILRSFLPFYKPKMWWITVRDLMRMHRTFNVTCIVAERI